MIYKMASAKKPNAYIKFVRENRERIAKKYPNATPQEIMKYVAAAYRSKSGKGKRGGAKSAEEILKDAIPVKADVNKLIGHPTPDGQTWYKNDKVEADFKTHKIYAKNPGTHIQDNVNNIFTKDGYIYIDKRYGTPLMKGVGFGPFANYKNTGGNIGVTDVINTALTAGYYNDIKKWYDQSALKFILDPLYDYVAPQVKEAVIKGIKDKMAGKGKKK